MLRIARVALQLSPLVQDPEHWKEAFTVTQDVEQPDGPITDPQLLNAVRPLLFLLLQTTGAVYILREGSC